MQTLFSFYKYGWNTRILVTGIFCDFAEKSKWNDSLDEWNIKRNSSAKTEVNNVWQKPKAANLITDHRCTWASLRPLQMSTYTICYTSGEIAWHIYRDGQSFYLSPGFDLLFSILFLFLRGKLCRWSFKWPEAVGGISGVKGRRESQRRDVNNRSKKEERGGKNVGGHEGWEMLRKGKW